MFGEIIQIKTKDVAQKCPTLLASPGKARRSSAPSSRQDRR